MAAAAGAGVASARGREMGTGGCFVCLLRVVGSYTKINSHMVSKKIIPRLSLHSNAVERLSIYRSALFMNL